jgi:hypothetical protein
MQIIIVVSGSKVEYRIDYKIGVVIGVIELEKKEI